MNFQTLSVLLIILIAAVYVGRRVFLNYARFRAIAVAAKPAAASAAAESQNPAVLLE